VPPQSTESSLRRRDGGSGERQLQLCSPRGDSAQRGAKQPHSQGPPACTPCPDPNRVFSPPGPCTSPGTGLRTMLMRHGRRTPLGMRERRCPWPGMGWGGVRVARPPTLGDPPAQERAPDALRAPDACSSQCPIIPSGPTGAGSPAVRRTLADPAVPSGPIVRAGPPCPTQPFQTSHRLSPSPSRSPNPPLHGAGAASPPSQHPSRHG